MKTPVYDAAGKQVSELELPADLFGVKRNDALVKQVVRAMEANARSRVAHAKDRGEVRGGGKKPWKQKGTGRARHGSSRSPIWRGGGTTHGPTKDREFSLKVSKKMRAGALAVVLSGKMRDGEVMFVDSLPFTKPATKDAKGTLSALGKVKGFEALGSRRKNAALIAIPARDTNAEKSFSNMGNVSVVEARNLNPVEVLRYRTLILISPEAVVDTIAARMKK